MEYDIAYEIYGQTYILPHGQRVPVATPFGTTEYFMYDYEYNVLEKQLSDGEFHPLYDSKAYHKVDKIEPQNMMPLFLAIASFTILFLNNNE